MRDHAQDGPGAKGAETEALPLRGPLAIFLWSPVPPVWQVKQVCGDVNSLLGYTADDFRTGRVTLPSLTHPDDRAGVESEIQRRLEAKQAGWSQDHRVITRAGDVRWFRSWHHVRYGSSGEAHEAQTLLLDITESRVAEMALRDSERRYRQLYESLSDPVVRVSMDGRIVEFNQAYREMLGYAADELGGLTYPAITPERWHALERMIVDTQILPRGFSELYEKEYRRKDGTVFPVELRTHLLRDEQGQASGMWAIVRDISRRKAEEEQLRASERKYRLIVETAQEGVWIIDEQSKTTFVNRHMAAMLGYTVEEMQGRSLLDFMDDEGRRQAHYNLQRRREGVGEQHEFRFLHKAGAPVWTLIETNPIMDEYGSYRGALAMVMDITNRRNSEQARRELESHIQRMQKSESLGIMAGGIAHDFNNILAAVTGNLDLALAKASASAPIRPNLVAAQEAARRAADLCRHMLAYSGGSLMDRRPLNLTQVVEEMNLGQCAGLPPSVQLTLEFQPGDQSVDADPAQIRQVISNLVANAAEAVGQGPGEIKITILRRTCHSSDLTSPWQDDSLPEGEYIAIKVCDTGCGMSADIMHRIFDPFFSTKFTGRGLGLPTALGIIRSHRGLIQAESRVGKGSTIRVLLPAARSPAPSTVRDTHSGSTQAGELTLMIVDDEPAVREVASQMLKRTGYSIITCADGAAATTALRRTRRGIDCVLLDVTMPGMGGEETIRELRKINPQVPVILMSGYSRQDIVARFAGLEVSDFLQKPFTMRALQDVVARLLSVSPGPAAR